MDVGPVAAASRDAQISDEATKAPAAPSAAGTWSEHRAVVARQRVVRGPVEDQLPQISRQVGLTPPPITSGRGRSDASRGGLAVRRMRLIERHVIVGSRPRIDALLVT